MGCDIHCIVECKDILGEWRELNLDVFSYRNYSVFGFLANVRNYSEIPPIYNPRGLPKDIKRSIKKVSFEGELSCFVSINGN